MKSVELCVISHPEMKKPLRCSNSIKVMAVSLRPRRSLGGGRRADRGRREAPSQRPPPKKLKNKKRLEPAKMTSKKIHVAQSRSDCTQCTALRHWHAGGPVAVFRAVTWAFHAGRTSDPFTSNLKRRNRKSFAHTETSATSALTCLQFELL